MAQGAGQAIAENKVADKINLVELDSGDKLIKLLTAGAIVALVVQDPYRMGSPTVTQLLIEENRCGFAPEIGIDGNRMDIARHLFRLPTSSKLAQFGEGPRNTPLSLPYGFLNSARQLGATACTFGRCRVSDWYKCLFLVRHYP
jgi:hypothetical protein